MGNTDGGRADRVGFRPFGNAQQLSTLLRGRRVQTRALCAAMSQHGFISTVQHTTLSRCCGVCFLPAQHPNRQHDENVVNGFLLLLSSDILRRTLLLHTLMAVPCHTAALWLREDSHQHGPGNEPVIGPRHPFSIPVQSRSPRVWRELWHKGRNLHPGVSTRQSSSTRTEASLPIFETEACPIHADSCPFHHAVVI